MNSPHLISKVFFNSVLLPAHITVSKSFFMNSNFMISKALLDIILLTGHSTLSEWRWTVLTRPGSSVLKKGVARNFEKKAVKSTIFKLEQSFFTYFWGSTKFQIEWCGLSGSGPAYLMSKAPFTSIGLPAHSTRLPHEQLHILSKALSISVILLADMTVAKYFFRMSSESTLDPRFFFSRTFSWNVILNGIYIWSILGKLWPLVCISIKLYSKI